jgi:hypothetical protein
MSITLRRAAAHCGQRDRGGGPNSEPPVEWQHRVPLPTAVVRACGARSGWALAAVSPTAPLENDPSEHRAQPPGRYFLLQRLSDKSLLRLARDDNKNNHRAETEVGLRLMGQPS